jgi:hypothetical protein
MLTPAGYFALNADTAPAKHMRKFTQCNEQTCYFIWFILHFFPLACTYKVSQKVKTKKDYTTRISHLSFVMFYVSNMLSQAATSIKKQPHENIIQKVGNNVFEMSSCCFFEKKTLQPC